MVRAEEPLRDLPPDLQIRGSGSEAPGGARVARGGEAGETCAGKGRDARDKVGALGGWG